MTRHRTIFLMSLAFVSTLTLILTHDALTAAMAVR